MYIRYPHTLSVRNSIRCISISANVLAKNHYNVLGIGPRATQAEIKSAYYKLSKVYHPDKNQGSQDAATKFRDITAAYEVLGHVRMRKLYDKGVHVEDTSFKHPEDPKLKFYKSRDDRHRPMGRTPMYDFDDWSRAHYGATFARDMERKRRNEFAKQMQARQDIDMKAEHVVFAFVFFLGVLIYLTREDYDSDSVFETAKNHKPKTS